VLLGLLHRLAHGERGPTQVDVLPAQPEQLATTQPCRDSDESGRVWVRPLGCVQQAGRLRPIESRHLPADGTGRFHSLGWGAHKQLLFRRLPERGVQHAVMVEYRFGV
jgi:hypothetical protein